jgi:hypothetical protein
LIDNPQLSAQLKFVSFIGQVVFQLPFICQAKSNVENKNNLFKNFDELAGVRTFSFDNFRNDQDSVDILILGRVD